MNWLAVNIHVKEMLMQTMPKKPRWKNTAGFVTSPAYTRHAFSWKKRCWWLVKLKCLMPVKGGAEHLRLLYKTHTPLWSYWKSKTSKVFLRENCECATWLCSEKQNGISVPQSIAGCRKTVSTPKKFWKWLRGSCEECKFLFLVTTREHVARRMQRIWLWEGCPSEI